MNNEIKEIHIKSYDEWLKYYKNATKEQVIEDLTQDVKYFADAVKDIKYLQEELKSANESISWWQNRFNAVEKENKKLKEELEITQEKWDKDIQFVECRTKEWLDYKTRNEKAIDYIKEHIRKDDEYPAYMEMLIEERDELLNILNGDNE